MRRGFDLRSRFVIATRGSKLALLQSGWVRDQLVAAAPEAVVELMPLKTRGDKILDAPLAKIGGKGLFVKEIEEAVLAGRAQAAVHSVKDMPALLPKGLHLAAVPPREDPRDVLISRSGQGLEELPRGARVGTASLRRTAQLLARRPDLEVVPLRGNVDTRLRKMAQGEVEAIVLAAAGLKRLGLVDRATQFLDPRIILPAAGQGALGVECRREDEAINKILVRLRDRRAWLEVAAERAFLARLEGGCQVPMACLARLKGQKIEVEGLVAGLKGRPLIRRRVSGPADLAEDLGRELAEVILSRGGREILAEAQR